MSSLLRSIYNIDDVLKGIRYATKKILLTLENPAWSDHGPAYREWSGRS